MPNNAIAAATAPVVDAILAGTPPRSWYAVNRKAEAQDEVEVSIYDEIGAWGVDAKTFVNEIRGITAKRINVRLNTPGGDVFDGTAIHNALRAHPAEVVVHIEGVAASAGSFIALAGDEVRMANNAYYMIHNASGGVFGGADDMRTYASLLEKINGNIASMYAAKSGKDPDHYRELMDAETWFTSDEALAEGLIDTVYAAAPAKLASRAAACTSVYNKIPDGARAMLGLTPTVAAPTETKAPEPSPRGEATPVVPTQEVTAMAETNNAPAQTPAAPSVSPDAGSVERDIGVLNADTMKRSYERGKEEGVKEGREIEQARMKAIYDACPGKPGIAVDSFMSGQTPESVKIAFDAATREREEADRQLKASELVNAREIARLNNLLASGGHVGVALGVAREEREQVPQMSPKQRAEWEWDNKPAVRTTAASKEIFVLAREAELSGTHRSFQREPAQVA